MDLFAEYFVGDLTNLVRADNKINLEIITNSAGVFVFLVRAQKFFFQKGCKRQI
jgi:intracellular sulfur oxidation DsrE/DsrF family protein